MSAVAFLAALVALLIGLWAGTAWERYKLREGRWIDRRKARESPHYILGLNFLVSNQVDLAIEELSTAASLDPEALGAVYRGAAQFRTPTAVKAGTAARSGKEAARRQTIAGRKASELAGASTSADRSTEGKDS